MNSISGSSEAQSIPNMQAIHNSETSQFQSDSSLANRNLNDAQNSSPNHSQTRIAEHLREDLFQTNQWTSHYSNPPTTSMTSEEHQRDDNIFTIPVLPNYSDLWTNPVSPPYPPPRYPDPPSYDAFVTLDGDGFENTASVTIYDMNTLTTPVSFDDDDDDDLVRKMNRTAFLACLVFWFCGFLFGGIAFLSAAIGKFHLKRKSYRKVKTWRDISFSISILGLLVGFIVLSLVLSVISGSFLKHSTCRPYGCWD